MSDNFQIFDFNLKLKTEEEEEKLINDFNDFFHQYNLDPLFTNEYRTSPIKVSWADAKGVLNESSSYSKLLISFSDILNTATDNKSYEEAVFKIIHEAKNFKKVMDNIRNYMYKIENLQSNHFFNTWNIVWYAKEFK